MGEIADMMLDGTMDPETGEWNFDGEDGPGFPMTGAQAAEWKRAGLDSAVVERSASRTRRRKNQRKRAASRKSKEGDQ